MSSTSMRSIMQHPSKPCVLKNVPSTISSCAGPSELMADVYDALADVYMHRTHPSLITHIERVCGKQMKCISPATKNHHYNLGRSCETGFIQAQRAYV